MNYKPKSRDNKFVLGFREVNQRSLLWEEAFFCFDREDLDEFKREELENLLVLLEGATQEAKDALEKSSK